MRHVYASVDAFVDVFDKKIVGFLDKNRESIVRQFREKAKRPVEDAEVEKFLANLGDQIYDAVQLDPSQLDRFANFYVGDAKLHEMIDGLIEGEVAFPKPIAASSPPDLANEIRAVAEAVRTGACSAAEARCRLDKLCCGLCA